MTDIEIASYNLLELVKAVHTNDPVTDAWIHRDERLILEEVLPSSNKWFQEYLLSLIKSRLKNFYDSILLDLC